jgi:glucose/mannose transport system substrate-binding protein
MRVLVAVVAMVVASVSAASAADTSGKPAVTVFHWWSSASELAAVKALGDVFEKENPGARFTAVEVDSPGGGAKIFSVVRAAAAAGNPPDAFQAHVGAPLRPYFVAGLLSPIDEVWRSQGLEKVVPPIIRTLSQIDDHYYSLPINVHRNNLIWYNKPLLDRHKIDPATLTTWSAFFEAAQKLEAAGIRTPLQIGENWTASVAFESIMASLGVSDYEDWINGKMTSGDDARLLEAFGILRTYLSHANKDRSTTTWDVAIRRVIGDWADGEFRLAGLKYGKDYGVIVVPGTRGMYGATIDAFSQARGVRDAAIADRWMRVAASRAGQDAFNAAKGSISARTDADPTRYDAYQRTAIADFKAARVIYPNLASSTHDAFKLSLDDVMTRFIDDLDVAKAAATIATSAARSKKHFSRAWSLK